MDIEEVLLHDRIHGLPSRDKKAALYVEKVYLFGGHVGKITDTEEVIVQIEH
jgi:hypothetical protein